MSICSGDLASAPRVYFLNFAAASLTLAFVSVLKEDTVTRCSCSVHTEFYAPRGVGVVALYVISLSCRGESVCAPPWGKGTFCFLKRVRQPMESAHSLREVQNIQPRLLASQVEMVLAREQDKNLSYQDSNIKSPFVFLGGGEPLPYRCKR